MGNIPKLLSLIADQISSNPYKIAYKQLTNNENILTLSNKELWSRTITVANRLQNKELTNQPRAILIFNTGFDFIYGLLGCFFSGTIAVPVPIPKPKSKELFNHFINHSNPKFIVTTSDLKVRIEQMLNDLNQSEIEIITIDTLKDGDVEFEVPKIIQSIAFIQYTSGSTAHPKGVMISFDNLYYNLKAIKQHFGLDKQSVSFSWLPHYHDMGLIDGLLTPIFNQCESIFCSPYLVVANPLLWLESIERFKVTHTGGPNFIFDLCVDKISNESASRIDLSSLSHIYISAEPVRKKTLLRFSDHFQKSGFKSNLFTPGYGLAEATLMVTCKERNKKLSYLSLDTIELRNEYVGLGKPIEGIKLKIVDPKTHAELPNGKPGEIVISGKTVASGYYNGDQSNIESFIELEENNIYFLTGDLGVLYNGELFIVGRLKNTLIINGTQYAAEDLEYVAGSSHPAILKNHCCAFSIEVENKEKAVLVVEIKKDKWDDHDKKVIHNKITEVIYDNFGIAIFDVLTLKQGMLPVTTSGKIKRSHCRKMYQENRFKMND